MIQQEDFDLETILSVLTGINCTDDFFKVYELYWYLFEIDGVLYGRDEFLNLKTGKNPNWYQLTIYKDSYNATKGGSTDEKPCF